MALAIVAFMAPPVDARTAATFVPGASETPESAATQPGPPSPDVVERQRYLATAIESYMESNPGFDVSVAIGDNESAISWGDDTAIETASIVKVEVLTRWLVARQGQPLPVEELRLAEDMIRLSDNEATNDLCGRIANETTAGLVPGGTDACVDHGLWGGEATTAVNQLDVIRTALTPGLLTTADVEVTHRLLSEVAPWQAWGVSAAVGENADVLLKNGWDLRDRGWLVNSIGVIETPDESPLRIAVLTRGHTDFEAGKAHVEAIAGLARTAFAQTPPSA